MSPRDIGTADTGVEGQIPLKPHHGFWDRLKSVGKGFLINAGQYAATHPDAGVGGLLGAGISGGVVGGVAPDRIDRQILDVRRAKEAARQAQELQRRKVEAETHKTEAETIEDPNNPGHYILAPQRPTPDPDERVIDGVIVRRQPDGSWKPTYGSPKGKEPIFKTKKRADGSEVQMASDDNGKTWREIPELGDAPPAEKGLTPNERQAYAERETQRKSKLDAAAQELTRLTAQEEEARKRKDAAYAELGRVQSDMTIPKEDIASRIATARQAAEKAQADYVSYEGRKNEAQKQIELYRNPEPEPAAAPRAPASTSGRTIEGAINAFKAKFKRAPTDEEVSRMKAALEQ